MPATSVVARKTQGIEMSATYHVKFENGEVLYIGAADAKSFKKKDVRSAYANARKRAEARYLKRHGKKVRAVDVRCVG